MNDYNEILHKAASQPDQLSDSDIAVLRRACREHPADAVAAALLLKYADSSLDDEERALARARVSLYTGDPRTLIAAIDPSGKGFDAFYPPLPADNRPSTSSAIDLFLETYGHQSPEEDDLLERMIFNPVPDYAEQLAKEQPAPTATPAHEPGSQDALIDAFLAARAEAEVASGAAPALPDTPEAPVPVAQEPAPEPAAQPMPPEKEPEPESAPAPKPEPVVPTSSLLSQSLAKIFIKQGRYERAYEIISNLSLNYPEKSVYFADQLRFLEKLIINQRFAK